MYFEFGFFFLKKLATIAKLVYEGNSSSNKIIGL